MPVGRPEPACAVNVWSHRGHNGAAVELLVPGEAQLMALAQQGIRGFDLDFFFAADASIGEIYAAHPVAMQTWLGLKSAQSSSVAQLQRAATSRADSHPILTADRVLTLIARHNLTVALDLKGAEQRPERHARQLLWLAERIHSTPGLAERAWLYVETTESARWSAAHSLLVWVVDDAPTLETLLQFGVGNVISNRPLHVRALARALCNRSRGGGANGGALSGGGVVDDELNCAGRGSHTCTV